MVDVHPKQFGKWKVIREIGEGGQGKVYLVEERKDIGLAQLIKNLAAATAMPKDFEDDLIDRIRQLDFRRGALKVLHQAEGYDKALARMKREVQALSNVNHPNVVKVLDQNLDDHWFVTEYFPAGPLGRHLARYRGNALDALKAFRDLVNALAHLHAIPVIHRDIKPDNIFVGSDGLLVLGDLGLVFFPRDDKTRLSETLESAGTVDWMAPWAHGERLKIEDANGKLDVFGMGKALYCLISGKPKLVFWYHRKPEYNLETLFPDAPGMDLVNHILDGCVCELEEKVRYPDAAALLQATDDVIAILSRRVSVPVEQSLRKCLMCSQGTYHLLDPVQDKTGNTITKHDTLASWGQNASAEQKALKLFICRLCGHVQLFDLNPRDADFRPSEFWRQAEGVE